jgi:hypothetical protein
MSALNFAEVCISSLSVGDVVLHNSKEMTVSNGDIKRCSFMGLTLFGDSYSLGRKKVLKGTLKSINGGADD